MVWPGIEPGSSDLESNAFTIRPPNRYTFSRVYIYTLKKWLVWPGFEPGHFWFVVKRLIRWATRPLYISRVQFYTLKKNAWSDQDSNLEFSDSESNALSVGPSDRYDDVWVECSVTPGYHMWFLHFEFWTLNSGHSSHMIIMDYPYFWVHKFVFSRLTTVCDVCDGYFTYSEVKLCVRK